VHIVEDIVVGVRDATQSASLPENQSQRQHPKLLPTDIIYGKYSFDMLVVIEEYKLIFFTILKVACSEWKALFRRMMGLNHQIHPKEVHNPKINGLKYLCDYSLEEALEIMTSEEWTRAVFVREPKERILSAFLDKASKTNSLF